MGRRAWGGQLTSTSFSVRLSAPAALANRRENSHAVGVVSLNFNAVSAAFSMASTSARLYV